MRGTLYVGTRSCPQAITAALKQHHDPIAVLIIADPQILGEQADDPHLSKGLQDIAKILETNAREQAKQAVKATQQDLANVFETAAKEPSERIITRITTDAGPDALESFMEEHAVREVFVARDALDILQHASIDPRGSLPKDAELFAV